MPRETWYTVPPSVFGTTFTFLQTTSYYGTDDILGITSFPGGTGCLFGKAGTATVNGYRADNAGGTTWTQSSGDVRGAGVWATAAYGYIIYPDESTETGTNPRFSRQAARLNPADGSVVHLFNLGGTRGQFAGATATDDLFTFVSNVQDSTPQLFKYNAAGTLTDTLSNVGAAVVDMATNDTVVVCLTLSETLVAFTAAGFSSLSTPVWTVNLATTPTLTIATVTEQCRVEHDGSGGFWVQGTFAADTNLLHITGDGVIDIEINLTTHTTLPGTLAAARGLGVDKYGHVYSLVVQTSGTGANADVIRFDETGAFVVSSNAQAITIPTTALSLCVDDVGDIFIGDSNGDITVLSQS